MMKSFPKPYKISVNYFLHFILGRQICVKYLLLVRFYEMYIILMNIIISPRKL